MEPDPASPALPSESRVLGESLGPSQRSQVSTDSGRHSPISPSSEPNGITPRIRRSYRPPSRIRPSKYARQDPANFKINPNLQSIIGEATTVLNQVEEGKVSVLQLQVDTEHINIAFVNKLKEMQEKRQITLQNQTVVVYVEGPEEDERYEILDGNHRVVALQQWYKRKFGPDSQRLLNAHFISAKIIRTELTPQARCFIAWEAHVATSVFLQARRNVKRNVETLLKLRKTFFPYMEDTAVLSRAYSTGLKSRIKLETRMEIPEQHVYIAFRRQEERGRLVELADQLERQVSDAKLMGKSSQKDRTGEKTTFWRRFIEVYDDRVEECRTELTAIVAEGRTGSLNTTDVLTRLRRKSSKLGIFLDTYYSHLPTTCYLFKPHAFKFTDTMDFISSCKSTFRLEELRKNKELPSVLRMLKAARLHFGNCEEIDPLVTTLSDLNVPDWKNEVLAYEAQFVFLDLEAFKDCAETVMYEIAKLERTLSSVLFLCHRPDFDAPEVHNTSWTELKKFLTNWHFDTHWGVLHLDVGFDAQNRNSFLLHYKKEASFKIHGKQDKFASLEQIPSMFPTNFCGVYFVGHRDCRRIARHTVPKRENNIIVYRYLEDLTLAHQVSRQVSGTQFWMSTRTIDYEDDETVE